MSAVQEFSIEEEFKKNTGLIREDIERLRDWIRTQPHLPQDHITDLDLALAYHCCDHSTEMSKQLLDINLTTRTLFTKLFKDRRVDEAVEKILNTALVTILPTRSTDGYTALYINFIDSDPKNCSLPDLLRTANELTVHLVLGDFRRPWTSDTLEEYSVRCRHEGLRVYLHCNFTGYIVLPTETQLTLMVIDLWQYEEGTWPGFVFLVDLGNIGIGHLQCFNFEMIQQIMYYVQEAIMVKTKAIHFINAPNFMDRIMGLIKPFMKDELLCLFNFHSSDSNSLEQKYPVEGLPKNAGGDFKTLHEIKSETLLKLKANKEFFEREAQKRVDETKRPNNTKTITDIFGSVEGSFKKLDID